jgi:uncharacterized protein YcnI
MLRRLLIATMSVACVLAASAAPASAHAIIELNGADAVAGHTSVMTLEIQHGCITAADGTQQVLAFVGKPWGRVAPKPVEGWSIATKRLSAGGQQITWTKQGEPQPFGTPVYFPMRVTWPTSPGVYGMSVTQACPSGTTTWDVKDGPATANAPSPPLTPLPQVKVLATVHATP